MRTPKTASELAAALRALFAARKPHLVIDGSGPAWSIVGNADRLQDLQAAAQALDDLASAYNAQLQALQFLPDGTVQPVFCGADCVDEGLCRGSQSCDRVGAESVGRANVAPAAAPFAPAGWKLVPVEPTPEMLVAGLGRRPWDGLPLRENRIDLRPAIYGAMLAAAPAAPAALNWTHPRTGEALPSTPQGWLHKLDIAKSTAWNAGYEAALRRAPAPAAPVTIETAPLGTKAPAVMGGAWVKVERGWKWGATGGTFPAPGGDWTGKLIPPAPAAPAAPAACPAREAMGENACQDRAKCWEPCGELGQSAGRVAVVNDYAPAPDVESEGGLS